MMPGQARSAFIRIPQVPHSLMGDTDEQLQESNYHYGKSPGPSGITRRQPIQKVPGGHYLKDEWAK